MESGFSYFGKIDCLLKEPDYAAMGEGEGWIIVDYKSSKSSIPAKKECKCDEDGKLADFQMPMYLKLVHTESNCKKIAAAVYRSIKEPDEKRFVVDIYEKDGKADFENAFKPTMDVFECYAGLFAEKAFAQAENGEADFTPRKHESMADRQSVRPNANCINCSFKQICRTTYALAPNEIPV